MARLLGSFSRQYGGSPCLRGHDPKDAAAFSDSKGHHRCRPRDDQPKGDQAVGRTRACPLWVHFGMPDAEAKGSEGSGPESSRTLYGGGAKAESQRGLGQLTFSGRCNKLIEKAMLLYRDE